MNINDLIIKKRKQRLAARGRAQGLELPAQRELPLVEFGAAGRELFICEIKRGSPSQGPLNEVPNPVEQADLYLKGGAGAVSVLTEEEFFHGSLADLVAVKKAHPRAAVLRNGFLDDEEDIDVSWRAGADAVLLIASALDGQKLARMHERARSLGMAALVEVYSAQDLEKVRPFAPPLTCINSRNPENFTVNLLHPAVIRRLIGWPTRAVFKSGIQCAEEARFAGRMGFDAVLVGEAAVRDPHAVPLLAASFREGRTGPVPEKFFWNALASRLGEKLISGDASPLVKICGLTNTEDTLAADSMGADILGFVFARSPRRVAPDFVAGLPETRALKAGVVVYGEAATPWDEICALVSSGKLNALQIHGNTGDLRLPCRDQRIPGYRALQPRSAEELRLLMMDNSPHNCRLLQGLCTGHRFLLDAFVPGMAGGTGKTLSPEILTALRGSPIWMAGGLSPENIGPIVRQWKPELVDISSGIESSPGKKDHARMEEFFARINGE